MLQRGNINIAFAQGLDTKTDPKQLSIGKFLQLDNSVFTTGGRVTKRNGYALLTSLPSSTPAAYLTTLNDNLIAVGSSVYAYSGPTNSWVTGGVYYPVEVSTLSLVKNSFNQIQADSVTAPNGLVCTAYTESTGGSTSYKFVVANSVTGQNVVPPTLIPVASGAVSGSPRVFLIDSYFVIVFTRLVSATSHLTYITVSSVAPSGTGLATNDIASAYIATQRLSWDGVVVGENLYVGYDTATGGQTVAVTYLSKSSAILGQPANTPNVTSGSGRTATIVSLTADVTNASVPNIYVSFYGSGSSTGYTYAVNSLLSQTLVATETITSGTVVNIASAAQNGLCTIFYEVANNYGYDSSIPTNYVNSVTVTSVGTVGSTTTVVRSVGLASKVALVEGTEYFLAAYESSAAAGAGFQPTYFLIDGTNSTEANPRVVAKLAYSNGGGYLAYGLPALYATGESLTVPYLLKDFIESQAPAGIQSVGLVAPAVYTQTGVELGTITLATANIGSVNVASTLQLTGGFGWLYDGVLPVEENFFLWPDSVEVSTSTGGGNIVGQPTGWVSGQPSYYVQVIYSWTDNEGNIYRSAPSIPVPVSGLTTSTTYTFTYSVPTLRLTYKIASPIRIQVYRWSVANQNYYEVTSITQPTLNSTTSDYVTITDTQNDTAIVGNNLIYTTGGVVEDVNSPASSIITLFDTRAWKVDAEDPNLLWYSKQVIENTPVEWSDLLTYYVAPNVGTSASTGPVTGLAPMDDKLIIFKKDAIYFINGTGPDNTGANSQYPGSPYFITSTVGCSNQESIVLMQNGLQFQSDKGIWLLGRDLSTQYIGAGVEAFNNQIVTSAVNVPETTQVRFPLSNGYTLMYDYYYQQWGSFTGVGASSVSSCLYQGLHTFINQYGQVYQESPGVYLDGSNPVLIRFETGPIYTSGISGYQRIYELALTGSYLSPHKLYVQIAFNYGASTQEYQILPTNYTGLYGSDSLYGQTSPFGGPGSLEQWRIQLDDQQCQSFQISLQEVYDPSYGQVAGGGFTLSNMNCLVGVKSGKRPYAASKTTG